MRYIYEHNEGSGDEIVVETPDWVKPPSSLTVSDRNTGEVHLFELAP